LGKFDEQNIHIDLGSDQTSLHNPWAGGYYPVGISFEEANTMMAENPLYSRRKYKKHCENTRRYNKHTAKGTYFFDYGNAFFGSFPCGSGYYGRKQYRFQVSKLRSRHHGTYVF
jgi:urocanate hydratase